ncbi:MAG TPA: hypothetical protein PK760_01500 [Flavobacteriales bacterium]|nr:hypothetical protein [Flavobacteriales bacterium]
MITNASFFQACSFLLLFTLAGCAFDDQGSRGQEDHGVPSTDGAQLAIQAAPVVTDTTKKIQLGLLLDTSNSMDGLIEQAKGQLWNIVNKLSDARCGEMRPTVEVALYEYGNDGLSARGNYIRRVLAFTTNMDEVSKELFALRTNGGNEYCGAVIGSSLDGLEWGDSDADMKLLFIAGNEEFTQGPVNFRSACERAKQKGIVVNTIFCGDHQEGINTAWSQGALAAAGSYFSIDQNSVTQQIASPYDGELAELEHEWDQANVYYGKQGSYMSANKEEQDANAISSGISTASKRREYKVKNSELNGSWDLTEVESSQLDRVLEKTEQDELPEQYRGLDRTQLKGEVLKLQAKKQALKQRIGVLNAQRETYVAEQTRNAPGANELENSILGAIERSAKAKGMKFVSPPAPVAPDGKTKAVLQDQAKEQG